MPIAVEIFAAILSPLLREISGKTPELALKIFNVFCSDGQPIFVVIPTAGGGEADIFQCNDLISARIREKFVIITYDVL